MNRFACNIVWFKRDLRLQDHQPLKEAIDAGLPVLLLYVLEPSLEQNPHYSLRHFRFVNECLADLNKQLESYNAKMLILRAEALDAFSFLLDKLEVNSVFSYQETGIQLTYDRDIKLGMLLKNKGVEWKEYQSNGVLRCKMNRLGWVDCWHKHVEQELHQPDLEKIIQLTCHEIKCVPDEWLQTPEAYRQRDARFQEGGEGIAQKYLKTAVDGRVKGFGKNISKPESSRKHCSRLSPYIAWGCLSIRQVHQALNSENGVRNIGKRDVAAISSRLRWHCHFIQKFEAECDMEFNHVNKGFNALNYENDATKLTAWQQGRTGWPLVDASMRCLKETGYVNFRMRAMLVSILTQTLNIDWRLGVHHLSRYFLDFEPGIHYGQFQMQAGVVGNHIVRTYNPFKQALDHDADCVFIKKWVPELQAFTKEEILAERGGAMHQLSFLSSSMDAVYPLPIVDFRSESRKNAKVLWDMKKAPLVKVELKRINKVHNNPD